MSLNAYVARNFKEGKYSKTLKYSRKKSVFRGDFQHES